MWRVKLAWILQNGRFYINDVKFQVCYFFGKFLWESSKDRYLNRVLCIRMNECFLWFNEYHLWALKYLSFKSASSLSGNTAINSRVGRFYFPYHCLNFQSVLNFHPHLHTVWSLILLQCDHQLLFICSGTRHVRPFCLRLVSFCCLYC